MSRINTPLYPVYPVNPVKKISRNAYLSHFMYLCTYLDDRMALTSYLQAAAPSRLTPFLFFNIT